MTELLSKHAIEVAWQLFRNGPTWDGNIISKAARDELHKLGYIDRLDGWQWLTREGVTLCFAAQFDKRKDAQQQGRERNNER